MIEWLAIPLVVAGAAFIPKGKTSDKKKIDMVFKNRKVGINKGESVQYPKLKSKTTHDTYTTYTYSLPLGIPSEALEMILQALKEALNKEIEYEFDRYLQIHVYEQELPKKWIYDESLIRHGTWEVPIGKNHQGILFHDFDKYAHFLIGGVPGFGKTVLMKSMLNTLILNNPDNVEIYILDLKGGLEFYKYKALPQIIEVACDPFQACDVLDKIVDEMHKAEELFRTKGYTNIVDTTIKKRTFIFVDEGAELSPDMKQGEAKQYAKFCQAALSEIARIGRAVGFRLIYGTQYPSAKSVDMSVKMNIVSRISFVAASQVSSRVILDDVGAEDLPTIPGRAIYKTEKSRTVQVPYIDDKMMFKMMEEREDVIINAGESGNPTNDHRPIGRS